MTDGLLHELLGFLWLPHVGRGDGHAGVRQTEVGVDGDCAPERRAGIGELAVRERLHRLRVLSHDVERRGRQRLGGKPPRGVRRAVAEGRPDAVAEIGGSAQHFLPAVGTGGLVGEDVAGDRLGGLQRHGIAAAIPLERAGQHHADTLLHGDLAPGRLVDRVGWRHAQAAADAVAVVGADEARALERQLQHRLQRAVERRVAGAVLQVRNQDRDRLVRDGHGGPSREPPRGAEERGHDQASRRRHLPGESTHERATAAVRRSRRAWPGRLSRSRDVAKRSAASGCTHRMTICSTASGIEGSMPRSGGGASRIRC